MKVKIPKDVAGAIVEFRKHYKDGAEFDLELIKREGWIYTDIIRAFTSESRTNLELYFAALVNGYEVEETPEERILESYHRKMASANNPCSSNWKNSVGFADGIKFTLNELGIKIEGVNA